MGDDRDIRLLNYSNVKKNLECMLCKLLIISSFLNCILLKKTGIIYKFEEIQRKYIDTSDEMSIIKITKQMWNAFHVFLPRDSIIFL